MNSFTQKNLERFCNAAVIFFLCVSSHGQGVDSPVMKGELQNEDFWSEVRTPEPPVDALSNGEVSVPQENEDFWSQLRDVESLSDPSSSSRLISPPDSRTLIVAAQDQLAKGNYVAAESLAYDALLSQDNAQPEVLDVTRQLLLLSLIRQTPFPVERASRAAVLVAKGGGSSSDALRNLRLRILLRQVVFTGAASPASADGQVGQQEVKLDPATSKEEVWKTGLGGLARLGSGTAIDVDAMGDLLVFAQLPLADRGVEVDVALSDLMLLAPDLESLRRLNEIRINNFVAAVNTESFERALALAILLSRNNASMHDSLIRYMDFAQAHPAATPAPDLTGKTLPDMEQVFKLRRAYLDERSLQRERSKDFPVSARREAWTLLFEGKADAAVMAFDSLPSAPSLKSSVRRLEESGLAEANESGRLQDFFAPLVRSGTTVRSPDGSGVEAMSSTASGASFTSVAPSTPRGDPVRDDSDSERAASGELDQFGAQVLLQRSPVQQFASDRAVTLLQSWTAKALEGSNDELATAWIAAAFALCENDPERAAALYENVEVLLREVSSRDRASLILGDLLKQDLDALSRARISYLLALCHFELGRMDDVMNVLDGPEIDFLKGEDDDRFFAIGLIRVTVSIQRGRFNEALSDLAALSDLEAKEEQQAQAAFLKGWVYLNLNQIDGAIIHFRSVVDQHPSTSFAPKAAALIDRLSAQTLEANGNASRSIP